MTSIQEKKQEVKHEVKRDARGRILPGYTANPGGRPSGPAKALIDIQNAIIEFEQEKGVSYWKAATLIAMKLANEGNTSLLGKILDKFVPTKLEGTGFADSNITNIFSGIEIDPARRRELIDALRTRRGKVESVQPD